MLKELHIKNFAIIDELHLTLESGLNILTGETGAGKSILIDAVALLLGGRADTSAVRKGASRARLEGLFILPPVQQQMIVPILEREGLEGESRDALWLTRELRTSGRTVARVNGSVVSVSLMREIAENLVDIHGQSEHLSLLRVRQHLALLDRFAGLNGARARMADSVHELLSVRQELKELRQSERERMQRIDLLRFQLEEIESANLVVGEQDELESELVRLSNTEQLASLTSDLLAYLEDSVDEKSPSVQDLLGQAQREMKSLVRIDNSLTPQAQTLAELGYQLDDVILTIRDYIAQLEFNPKRLSWVQDRLSLLRQFGRKYGGGVAAILTHAENAAKQLETLEHSDERITELVEEERALLETCAGMCLELSRQRQEAAARLAAGVEHELNDLLMEGARFGVVFRRHYDAKGLPLADPVPSELTVTPTGREMTNKELVLPVSFDVSGMDQVEFVIAPNVGEGLKPMVQIASGGETARLMLALKTVLSRADQTPTLIFDEIDQGIGGRVGATVGEKLWRLASHAGGSVEPQIAGQDVVLDHQVLCITHLPQLAGFGDVHFKVQKHVADGRTVTRVNRLNPETRTSELAQMLGTQGDAARQGAMEILSRVGDLKAGNG